MRATATAESATGDLSEADSATASITQRLDAWLAARRPELIRLRRHLHANPELSGREFATATLLAQRLTSAGLRPTMLPKGNGVICDVGERRDGDKVVALRADLDALPVDDLKDVPYRSVVPQVCHACGHDVHATVVLAAGLFLASLGDVLPGQVRLLFQPAEEILPCGALEVIDAGGLTDVAEIFAVHCDPKLPAGQVGLRVGPLTAAVDNLSVQLKGPGGHTARPHLSVDLVDALGRLVTQVPALIGRRVDARAGMLLVFGQIAAGTVGNVIPTEGSASGTVRVLSRDAWHAAPRLVTRIVQDVLAPTGVTVEIDYQRGRPPVVNAADSIQVMTRAAVTGLGADSVADTPQSMGGEDFSWYLEQVPGAMARLGVGRPGEDLDLHQGTFDIDEQAIDAGVRFLVYTALTALSS
ncbi:MAG TPA: amidohydrolase [Micromonosporaceae bacterium]